MPISHTMKTAFAVATTALLLSACGKKTEDVTMVVRPDGQAVKMLGKEQGVTKMETSDGSWVYAFDNTRTVRLQYPSGREGVVANYKESQFCTFTTKWRDDERSDIPMCKNFNDVTHPDNQKLIKELHGYLDVKTFVKPAAAAQK